MEISPPQAHRSLLASVKAGRPPMRTLEAGFDQDPTGTGTQGMGVKAPMAAVVALATVGLDRLLQSPNGGIFVIGTMSVSTPVGLSPARTRAAGKELKTAGIDPNGHFKTAPAHTQKCIAEFTPPSFATELLSLGPGQTVPAGYWAPPEAPSPDRPPAAADCRYSARGLFSPGG